MNTRSPRFPRRHRLALAELYARDVPEAAISRILGISESQVAAAIGVLDGAPDVDLPSIVLTRASVSVVYLTPDPDLDGPHIPVVKRRKRTIPECGSVRAAARHYRYQEPLDEECRESWAAYSQQMKAAQRARKATS